MKNKILTPNQVAEMMMVSPATVRQWAANGKLEALTTPGGHRRFRMTDIISFAEK
ncbi:MAG: helix-turn-helix domain-containing protein, partial [Gammaproteobacteria bacterium]|nr:helix-turn-helix domain-containing protein [Gammaproteobacteria bacterium]